MKKILLINTPVRLSHDASFFPVGLGSIATVINKTGRPMEIMDLNLHRPSMEEVKNAIKKSNADYIGVSGMAIQFGFVREYARFAKEVLPHCTVIAGGRVTAVPELVLKVKEVDYCVMGDGEETIIELLDYLDKGLSPINSNVTPAEGEPPNIAGIAAVRDGRVVETERRPYTKNLDVYGPIDYTLFNTEQYIENQINTGAHRGGGGIGGNIRSLNMVSTRGCPFRCSFCGEDLDALRIRSIESLFDEIEQLVAKYNVQHIHFSDGLFINKKSRTMAFADEYDKRGMHFTWSGNGRADITTEELVKRIIRSGCNHLGYGFETGSPRMMKAMNKTTTIEHNARTIELHRKHNLRFSSSFIFGVPGETAWTMMETALFIMKYCFKPSGINFMMVYPGTPDWTYCMETKTIKDPHAYLDSIAAEVNERSYAVLRPLVNMSSLSDKNYYYWGKFLQAIIAFRLNLHYTAQFFKERGLLSTLGKIVRKLVDGLGISVFEHKKNPSR